MVRKINVDPETFTDDQKRLWEALKKNRYVIKPNDPLLLLKIEMDRKRAEFEEKSKNYMVQVIS